MNRRLAFSLRLLWVLTLLASLGVVFAALAGGFNERAVAGPAAETSTLAIVGRWLSGGFLLSATLVSLALACVLFWKKAIEGMALYLSFFLLPWGIIWSGSLESFADYWLPQTPEIGGQLAGLLMPLPLLVLLLVFPNGQFAPRWTICLLPLAIVPLGLMAINTLDAESVTGWLWPLCFYAVSIQVYRYRRLYTPLRHRYHHPPHAGLQCPDTHAWIGVPRLYSAHTRARCTVYRRLRTGDCGLNAGDRRAVSPAAATDSERDRQALLSPQIRRGQSAGRLWRHGARRDRPRTADH
jgi:hypothetical protein